MLALCYSCPPWRYVAGRALGAVWKGVYLSGLAAARLREVEPAKIPNGWAMVRVKQCGLCASDVHLIRLQFSPFTVPVAMAGEENSPCILGHELVGTIEQVGADCPLPVGTRVISRSGSFRNCFNLGADPCSQCARGEYALCLRQGHPVPPYEPLRGGGYAQRYWEHAANLLPVPEKLSDNAAMLAEPLACSLRAVLRLPLESPARVLVVGAGLLGLGAVHWLKSLRPRDEAACLARHDHQASLAAKLGAANVVRGRGGAEELTAITKTRCLRGPGGDEVLEDGFDAVIDSIGTPETVHSALRWIRPGGCLIILGAHLAPGRLDYSPIWFRQIDVRGVLAHGMENFRGRAISTLALTMELLAQEAPLPAELVSHRVPLQDFRQALRLYDDKAAAKTIRVAICP